jgi:hypothetical protein
VSKEYDPRAVMEEGRLRHETAKIFWKNKQRNRRYLADEEEASSLLLALVAPFAEIAATIFVPIVFLLALAAIAIECWPLPLSFDCAHDSSSVISPRTAADPQVLTRNFLS